MSNWRIYRCSERQLQLVTQKARKIIRAIDNASKGKVFVTKLRCARIVRKIKSLFTSWFMDRPYDRIASQITKSSCYEAVVFNDTKGEAYSKEVFNKLKWGHMQICPKIGFTDVQVVPIETTGVIRFGYLWNFRIGKSVGKIILKTPKDKGVKIRSLHHTVKLDLVDNWPHKIVIMWQKLDDNNHLFYDVVKIRQYIE